MSDLSFGVELRWSGAAREGAGEIHTDDLVLELSAPDPTVVGGDLARQTEYEAAATVAHERCFIGHSLAPEVAYEVGCMRVREGAPTTASGQAAPAPRMA